MWSVTWFFPNLSFALDSKLVHTSAGPAGIVNQLTVFGTGAIICLPGGSRVMMTYVDGSGLVKESHKRLNDGKYVGKFTCSLMMKDMNTIVIKVASDHLKGGIRDVITTVAQRE